MTDTQSNPEQLAERLRFHASHATHGGGSWAQVSVDEIEHEWLGVPGVPPLVARPWHKFVEDRDRLRPKGSKAVYYVQIRDEVLREWAEKVFPTKTAIEVLADIMQAVNRPITAKEEKTDG